MEGTVTGNENRENEANITKNEQPKHVCAFLSCTTIWILSSLNCGSQLPRVYFLDGIKVFLGIYKEGILGRKGRWLGPQHFLPAGKGSAFKCYIHVFNAAQGPFSSTFLFAMCFA